MHETIGGAKHSFRPDIEGLRAIAVLLVVVFHINESLIPGGFIGVDLFFVISGYVITQRINAAGLSSPPDFLEFYRRRIRRIAPAMLFVTTITLVAGTLILLPDDLVELSFSAVAASLSAANIYFATVLDTGYFAKDSSSVPLLHLWSLGVEEQFYFAWPFLLFVLAKRPRIIVPALSTIVVASIFWGEFWLRTQNPTLAYYMLPSRAFQLCAGGLALFWTRNDAIRRLPSGALLASGAIGIFAIVTSSIWLSSETPYPGINAVPITVGTVLLLIAGTKGHILTRVLSFRPARYVGRISYSMYLWHWPLLAYLHYVNIEIDAVAGVLVFAATTILAIVTNKFVEEPYRHSNQSFKKVLMLSFVAPSAMVVLLAVTLVELGGVVPLIMQPSLQDEIAEIRQATRENKLHPYVCLGRRVTQAKTIDNDCVVGGATPPSRVLLWGDSNAAHYVGVLGAIAKDQGASFRNIAHSSCPPLVLHAGKFASRKPSEDCEISANVVTQILPKYDHVILSAQYSTYLNMDGDFLAAFADTLRELRSRGKRVTVIGQVVTYSKYDSLCTAKALRLPIDCTSSFKDMMPYIDEVNSKIKNAAQDVGGVEFYAFNELLCSKGTCSPYIDGLPVYLNKSHLSIDGSWRIGALAVQSGKYRHMFGNGSVARSSF